MKLRMIGTNQSVLEFKDGTRILFSYETPVAAFIPNEGYRQTREHISRTSLKHAQKWIGREPVLLVSQEEIAQFINSQMGKHQAVEVK